MRRRGRFARRCSVVLVLAALIVAPSGASAAVTVGQTFVPTTAATCEGPFEVLQTGRASGPSYAIPSNGVLSSWSFEAASVQTVMTLGVFRPTGTAHRYQAIADGGGLRTIGASSGLNTFPSQIPVRAGDLIGIRGRSGTCATETSNPADTVDVKSGFTTIGDATDFASNSGFIVDISAVFSPSNSFTFGDVTRNKKKGTATLTVNVPNPGELTGSGKGVSAAGAAVTSKAVSGGQAQLLIKAKGKKKRKLNETGKVKLSVAVTYTPTGGDPSTQSLKVKLKKRQG